MSSWTSLKFYRPTDPPLITGENLGAFLREFARLGITDNRSQFETTVKFGARVDQDERPSTWEEPIEPGASIWQARTLDWDLRAKPGPLVGAADWIAQWDKPIYRAWVPLGDLRTEIRDCLQRISGGDDARGLSLFTCGLEIGPIIMANLKTETPVFGGWIAISLGGDGQVYPWTSHGLVAKAEGCIPLRRLTDLCRRFWPVRPVKVTAEIRAVRRAMGDLWPYKDDDRDVDWHWAACEG